MKIKCPKCFQTIPSDQINISTDLAFCEKCNESFYVSDFVDMTYVDPDIINQEPPHGTWIRQEMYNMVIGATTKSRVVLFLLPFMCIWSGFSLGGIYGTQIMSQKFNLLNSLFGIPFVIVTFFLGGCTLMGLFGKVEVSIGKNSFVFVGIGSLGWTRRFDWEAVKSIQEDYSHNNLTGIHLVGSNRIKFGSNLNDERKYFILNVLKHLKYNGANKSL